MRPNVTHGGVMRDTIRKSTKVNTPKAAKKYPYIPFRPSGALDVRLRELSKQTGLSRSWIINRCLVVHLPTIEADTKRLTATA